MWEDQPEYMISVPKRDDYYSEGEIYAPFWNQEGHPNKERANDTVTEATI